MLFCFFCMLSLILQEIVISQYNFKMKKKQVERSGVARCQKCFKYGHYTYECQNQAVYRYRPSRTMQFKQKLQMQIKASKPPKTSIVNPDYKRRVVEDGPSSDSNEQEQPQNKNVKIQKPETDQKPIQNPIQDKQNNKQEHQSQKQQAQNEEQSESDQSSDSSSSDSSSDSNSSSSSSDSQQKSEISNKERKRKS